MKSNLLSGFSPVVVAIFLCVSGAQAQQGVAIGDSNPKTNAILYLKGNGSQGLIIPVVSSLGNFGEAGMVVYNSTDKRIHFHDGNSWSVVGGGVSSTDLIVGNEVSSVGTNAGLVLSGSGSAASPLTVSLISGTANGQILKWNSSNNRWELGTDNSGSASLNSAQILVGNASNVATATTMSGDATLSNTGALTIGNGTINSAKILDGAITNADINANAAIAPSKIGQAAAANGQVLKWNGSAWAPAADDAGSVALNSAQILVGNASNVPTATSMSGDATLSNTGALTIGNAAVNSAKILDGAITNADINSNAAIAPSKIGQAAAANGQVLKWNGSAWAPAADDAGSVALNSAQILVGNASNVPTATSMSGDATLSNTGALTIGNGTINSAKILDGAITNADINANAAIAPSKIGQGAAAAGQVLKWNGSAWAPAADDAGLSSTLNSGQILVGSAGNTATPVTMSGDATITNTGALTVGANAITSAKIADGTVSTADIANGTIANIDVATNAAIDGSKINPDFVAQNINTTGTTSTGNLTASGTVSFNALTGAGVRMVTTDASGMLGSQAIPSLSFSTSNVVPKGDGTGLTASQIYDDGTFIGIGTNAPGYLVDVQRTLSSATDSHIRVYNPSANAGDKAGIRFGTGSGWAVHLNTVTNGDWLELTNNAGTAAHRWTFQAYYPGAGAAYIIGTGLDMAIMNGFLGVGTQTPDRKLDVTDAPYQVMRLNSLSAGAGLELVSATNNDWMVTTWNGNFYLVQSTNNFTSQADQYIFTTSYFASASDNTRALGGGGLRWTAVYATNGTIQTSDARLKSNVTDLKYGLEEVLALRPVSYTWKSDTRSRKVGLIAQEVQKIIPEVVTEDEYLGMNYGELVPVLINAIQEQQKTIDELKTKLRDTEAKTAELESVKAEIETIKRALGMEANKTTD